MNILSTVDRNKYKEDRVILHSDCNGFYASVECLHNPQLRDMSDMIREETEKIAELESNQLTIQRSLSEIEDLMAWKAVE